MWSTINSRENDETNKNQDTLLLEKRRSLAENSLVFNKKENKQQKRLPARRKKSEVRVQFFMLQREKCVQMIEDEVDWKFD